MKLAKMLLRIAEVDLSYGEHLHREHHDFPLAPESMDILYHHLSSYSKELHDKMYPHRAGRYKAKKLVGHFGDRHRYTVHGECLVYYLQKGLTLKKIHRICSFQQQPFLKPFIQKCTGSIGQSKNPVWAYSPSFFLISALRATAKSDIEKQIYKLFANR